MNPFSIRKFMKVKFGAKLKALLLFVASLGLPSLFLLFLAIRGIENDQALEEQKLLTHHGGIADSLAAEVDREISSLENRLHGLIDVMISGDETGHEELLAEFASSPLIDEIFILHDDHLQFPHGDLLYGAESGLTLQEKVRPGGVELDRLIDRAERAEFQHKNYTRAATLYRAALNRANDNITRADLLMRIARVSVRVGDIAKAREAFRAVSEHHNQSRLPGGLPGGLASRLELTGLTLRTGDTVGATVMTQRLYEDLLAGAWTLTRSQFSLARNKMESVAEILTRTSADVDHVATLNIVDLIRRTDSLVSRTDFLLDLSNLISPVILGLTRERVDKRSLITRKVIEDNNHQNLLLIAGGSEHAGRDLICVGALIDNEALLTTVVSTIVNSLPLGDNHSLTISNIRGERLYGSPPPALARLTTARAFRDNFPPWSIELYQVDPRFFEEILSSRRSIYIVALVIVMLALTLGAIVTARLMARELELARLKSDFVSTVSHEFRSPLTSIRQLSEMLQSGRVQTEERRTHYYGVILEQSERLSLMVSNILDLARIDENRFRLNRERISVEELLEEITTRASQMVSDKEVQIRLCINDPLPLVLIDPEAITHVMNNLIDNAIKYSGESIAIFVTVFRDDADLIITVKDHGIGISGDETDRVFDRFYRGGDEFTRNIKGSGLGLSLVRELIAAHGGSVNVVSEVKKGSLFTVRLPLSIDEGNSSG